MKFSKIIYLTLVCLLIINCKKDDDQIMPQNNLEEEIVQETILIPEGRIDIAGYDAMFTLNFNDGSLIQELPLSENKQTKTNGDNTFEFTTNSIKKTIVGSTASSWIKEYPDVAGKSIRLDEASVAFSTNAIFIAYQILNADYSSEYFIEALDINNGDNLWKVEISHRTEVFVYQNRLITIEYLNGSSPVNIQYRNIILGAVEVEKIFNERISQYSFHGDLIIANSWSNRVFALDRSLNTAWSFETGEENVSGSFISDNQFIFFSRDEHLYSLNANSGALNWKTRTLGRSKLGLHHIEKDIYIAQQTVLKTFTLSKVDADNGELKGTFDVPMSEDYYTTKLTFHKDFLLVITSPTSDDNAIGIEAKLLALEQSLEVWKNTLNIKMKWYVPIQIATD